MKELTDGGGIAVTYVINPDKDKYSLKGNYYGVWNSISKGNHYRKVLAQDLNINETKISRILNTMLKHGLIEKKTSHDMKLEDAPDSIKELIKNKDLRTVFYFPLAKETKSYTPEESSKKIVKEIKQVRKEISDLKNKPQNNSQQSNPQLLTLFSTIIALIVIIPLTIFEFTNMLLNITEQFPFTTSLITTVMITIAFITSYKNYKKATTGK